MDSRAMLMISLLVLTLFVAGCGEQAGEAFTAVKKPVSPKPATAESPKLTTAPTPYVPGDRVGSASSALIADPSGRAFVSPVRNLAVRNSGSDSIQWCWQKPEPVASVHHVDVYVNDVYISEVLEDCYTLRNIPKYGQFKIKVVSVGPDGNKSSSLENSAFSGNEYFKVRNLEVTDTQYTSANIRWDEPRPSAPNYVFQVFDNDVLKGEVVGGLSSYSYAVTGLSDNANHNLRVATLESPSRSVLSSGVTVRVNTRPDLLEGFYVRGPRLVSVSSNSVDFRWMNPYGQYSTVEFFVNDVFMGETGPRESYSLSGLSPGTRYEIKMVPVNTYGMRQVYSAASSFVFTTNP